MLQTTNFMEQYSSAVSALLLYHRDLEHEARFAGLNEVLLEEKLKELDQVRPFRDEMYWLSLARITELAIVCAGNYADNGEFSAAGDLLVNPRLVLVYTKNQVRPIKKERHTPLSVQFARHGASARETRTWLRDNTIVTVQERPLLPHLYDALKNSGCIAEHYLVSACQRMGQVARTIGFLAAWQVSDQTDLHQRLRLVSEEERLFITAHLCRFSMDIFDQLGHDVLGMTMDERHKSTFIS